MKHFHTRLKQLEELISTYNYPLPFSEHLKSYFQKNKNAGSKDRREIRALAYAFFRVSPALQGKPFEEIAAIAASLAESSDNVEDFLQKTPELSVDRVFPFNTYLAEPFHNPGFQKSFLQQPRVWIKTLPGKVTQVQAELNAAEIPFEIHEPETLSFGSEQNLTTLKSYTEGWFRVQDLASQTVCKAFKPIAGETWWDCCAGAGGKSLALLEQQHDINLYASDIRESILKNLAQRHEKIGTGRVNIFAADVSQTGVERKLPPFDGIIVDAPCSGSGTWARNPENLVYFSTDQIAAYQARQIAILNNVFPFLKTGKPIIYITCSVFAMENEDVIRAFTAKHNVEIEEQKYVEGYLQGAENMFLCRMIKKA